MIELAPQEPERMEYDQAWLYCATLTYDNKYDWRMPTNWEWNRTAGMRSWFELSLDIYHPLDLYLPVIPVRTV